MVVVRVAEGAWCGKFTCLVLSVRYVLPESEFQPGLVSRMAVIGFCIWSIGAFLQAARVGDVERLSSDCMMKHHKSACASLGAPLLLIKERFSFGILRPSDCLDVTSVLVSIAIAYFCEVDWSALGD